MCVSAVHVRQRGRKVVWHCCHGDDMLRMAVEFVVYGMGECVCPRNGCKKRGEGGQGAMGNKNAVGCFMGEDGGHPAASIFANAARFELCVRRHLT